MEISKRKVDMEDSIYNNCGINTESCKMELYHFGPEGFIFSGYLARWTRFIREMPVSDNDVWLLSFPRSGNTWAREMAWLLLNNLNFEEAKEHTLNTRSPYFEEDINHDIYPGSNDTSLERIAKTGGRSPRLIKSHLPLSLLPQGLLSSRAKIIYIERNVKDVCVSNYHLSELFFGYKGSLNEYADAFLADRVHNTPYWAYVKEFFQVRSHANVLHLKYEEMSMNIVAAIQRVADFLGKTLTPEEMSNMQHHLSFNKMRANVSTNCVSQIDNLRCSLGLSDTPAKSEYIRKGIVGSWKEEMSMETIRKFDSWIAENSPV